MVFHPNLIQLKSKLNTIAINYLSAFSNQVDTMCFI